MVITQLKYSWCFKGRHGVWGFHWRQFQKERAAAWLQSTFKCSEFAEILSCSVLFPTVLFSSHLWCNQGNIGTFSQCERCRSVWPEIEFSFGSYSICSDAFTHLAWSSQGQGPGRPLSTWEKCTYLGLPPRLDSAARVVSNSGGVPSRWKLWRWHVFSWMISVLLARKQPRNTDSVTVATISSRKIRWIKVTNSHKKKMPSHPTCIPIHYKRITCRI